MIRKGSPGDVPFMRSMLAHAYGWRVNALDADIPLTRYVDNPRALPPEELQSMARSLTDRPFHVAADPIAAWKLACRLAGRDDLIV